MLLLLAAATSENNDQDDECQGGATNNDSHIHGVGFLIVVRIRNIVGTFGSIRGVHSVLIVICIRSISPRLIFVFILSVFWIVIIWRPVFVFLSYEDLDVVVILLGLWSHIKGNIVFFQEGISYIPGVLVGFLVSKDL